MLDQLIKELDKLNNVSIDIPLDDDGYYDRECPATVCQATFKVLFEDWKNKVRDEEVFCPRCRKAAPATQWHTQEQVKYIESAAIAKIQGVIGNALQRDVQNFNRRQPKGGFVQISLSYKPDARPIVIPVEAAELMQQKYTCELCDCRYASIGSAFFCPACGHNSVETAFEETVQNICKTLAALPHIRETLTKELNKDEAENTCRQTLEMNMNKLVGSFEHLAKSLYETLPTARKLLRPNVFQNVEDGSKLWKQAIGKGYEDLVSVKDLQDLKRLFEQRHVLTHADGKVDERYIRRSGDHTYVVGQRLVVKEAEVLLLAEIVLKLGKQLGVGRPVPQSMESTSQGSIKVDEVAARAAERGYREVACGTCERTGVEKSPNANSPTGWDEHAPCRNCEGSGRNWSNGTVNTLNDRELMLLA